MTAPAVTVLLRLRWVQLRHAFPAFGIALLALSTGGAVWAVRHAVQVTPAHGAYIAGASVLLTIGLHQGRGDHHFLQRHVPLGRQTMALEYAALSLPVLVGLLLGGAGAAVMLLPLGLIVPWLPVVRASGTRALWLRRRIPAHLFEWKGLLQTTHPWGLLLWLAALGLCWLPVLPMFLLGIMALLICGAMEPCEPRTMLLATARDGRTLLRAKVFASAKRMAALELPVLLGATLVRPAWWWIHVGFGAGMVVLVAYAVVLKYANYRPNERLVANSAHVGVAAVLAILPGLCLAPVIMLLTEWPKARRNLNAYFHDHHR